MILNYQNLGKVRNNFNFLENPKPSEINSPDTSNNIKSIANQPSHIDTNTLNNINSENTIKIENTIKDLNKPEVMEIPSNNVNYVTQTTQINPPYLNKDESNIEVNNYHINQPISSETANTQSISAKTVIDNQFNDIQNSRNGFNNIQNPYVPNYNYYNLLSLMGSDETHVDLNTYNSLFNTNYYRNNNFRSAFMGNNNFQIGIE